MRHVVFRIDRDRYALPLSAVREVVVNSNAYARVPRAPPHVRGVINLRGRVVPVVELPGLLGSPAAQQPLSRVVLLDRGRHELGLLVTDVDGIEVIERLVATPGPTGPFVRGVARLGALAVTVLDPDRLENTLAASFTRM